MSRSIFIVGSVLLMAVAFSHGSPYWGSVYSQQEPGAVSANEQCQRRNPELYIGACQVPDPSTRCEHLMCSAKRGDIPSGEDIGPAHDGTWCGPRKACFEGTCSGTSRFPTDPFLHDQYHYCNFEI